MINIVQFVKQKFCKHEREEVTLELHGDDTAEEIHICTKCGRKEIHTFK